jgi:histidinol-phosphate aminotransferase
MTTQWESLANEHILGIAPYEPGKPIEELERELGIHDAIKLASNENPLPPSDRVQQAIVAALAHLNRYPDGSGFYLRQALAKRHGVAPEQVILGNGSNELIELLVRTFLRPGDEAIVPHPSFVVYPMIVQAAGGVRVMVMLRDYRLDLEAMARALTPLTKLVFIANPNNPTATIVTAEEVEQFLARVPERTIVVFDEAYVEFAQGPDFPDTLSYVKQGRRVIVLRTFSKAASLAGLRVGYGIADADATALMNRIRQPFNVNSLAQVAALAALEDDAHVLECVRMIEAGRHFLYDEFQALGLRYVPSRANFILVDVGRSAQEIYQKLLHEGVIVRPMTPFGMETALRVTVGTPEENRRLVRALRTVLGKKPR